MRQVSNLRIASMTPLDSADDFVAKLPITEEIAELVATSREQIGRIIRGEDDRMLVVVGPCSIHDEKAGLEYAQRLLGLKKKIGDRIVVVMRTYFEKPRTTVGWKGFINDPHLNGSFDVPTGLFRARKFILDVLSLGLPTAIEWLDPVTPQYLADIICLGFIGARTVESQTHRQLASGLSMPIGFKNGTGGTGHSIQIAVDALVAARAEHTILSVLGNGRVGVAQTTGNPDTLVVLRGGVQGPNCTPPHVADAVARLEKAGLPPYLMVDCSHGNSGKDHRNQPIVFASVIEQRAAGNRHVVAVMLESHLFEGNQKLNGDASGLKYGVSITDACIGWEATEQLLLGAHSRLRAVERVGV